MPEVILNGPHGRIECRYHSGQSPDSPIALILHPEPNQGGSMNNKVAYAMYHEFRNRGFSVLRFNFRGVGRSEGIYEGGEGELADAAAVLDWVQSQNIHSRYTVIAGCSFCSCSVLWSCIEIGIRHRRPVPTAEPRFQAQVAVLSCCVVRQGWPILMFWACSSNLLSSFAVFW